MKGAVALLLAIAGTFVLAQPAAAQTSGRVTVATPLVHRDGGEVVVRGRASANVPSVRIQKRLGGVWVTARRASVSNGVYGARVPATSTTSTTIRAVADRTVSRTVTVPQAAPASTDSCGSRPVKSDGSRWSCSFVDDFNGTALDPAKWKVHTDFASGVQAAHACYVDDPSVVNVANGTLNLSVRKVADPVSCAFGGLSGPTDYIAGGVLTYRLFSQQYGRFEARFKNTATTSKGLHEAFWLWPDDRVESTTVWPMAGEIDVAELYSSYANLMIPYLHYGAIGPQPTINTAWNCAAARGVFNTYTLVWSATRIEILVNGRTCLVNTSGDPAFKKPYIMALTQALGAAGNEYAGSAPLPASMNVDYVKVWR